MKALRAAGQIALGGLSWSFHWTMRGGLRMLTALHVARRRDNDCWRVFSEAMLAQPLTLPAILTSAPRWNPHAVIATAGPVRIRRSLSLDPALAAQSAASWSMSVYSFPWHRCVGALGTLFPAKNELELPAGRYIFAWRFQDPGDAPRIPAVLVDGEPRIDVCELNRDVNRFYDTLAQRTTPFLIGLNYYAYVMLRYRDWLPAGWVARQYLPVGSTDTHFMFGPLAARERIRVTISAETLTTHEVTLTQYNLASLPTFWTRLERPDFENEPSARAGHYLIRIRRKPETDLRIRPAVQVAAIASE